MSKNTSANYTQTTELELKTLITKLNVILNQLTMHQLNMYILKSSLFMIRTSRMDNVHATPSHTSGMDSVFLKFEFVYAKISNW